MFEEDPAFHITKESFLKDNKANGIPIVPELPGFSNLGSAFIDSLRSADTGRAVEGDISLVDSIVNDYATIGASLSRIGGSIQDFGRSVVDGVADSVVSMGKTVTAELNKKQEQLA